MNQVLNTAESVAPAVTQEVCVRTVSDLVPNVALAEKGTSMNSSLREGWPFYAVLVAAAGIAAALVLIPNAPLVFIVLIVNVIATLAMPPAIVFLLLLVNDREVMGEHANRGLSNFFGVTVTILLVLAGIIFGITMVFPHLLPS